MRETPYEDIAAEPVDPPPEPPAKPQFRPTCLRMRYDVCNRVEGKISPVSVARYSSLAEAQEAAHERARALRLPVFEVAPWESLTQVADRDGVYLSFTVYDELKGEIVRDSKFGEEIWERAKRG